MQGRAHLENLVPYLLSQTSHHGLRVHPALWNGSCFLDLVGARAISGLHLQLFDALPRYRIADVMEAVGLPRKPVVPFDDRQLREMGAAALARVAAVALAVGPDLVGRTEEVVSARAAVCVLAASVGIATREIAVVMNLAPRTVQRITATPVDQAVLRSVRTYLALESLVRRLIDTESAERRAAGG